MQPDVMYHGWCLDMKAGFTAVEILRPQWIPSEHSVNAWRTLQSQLINDLRSSARTKLDNSNTLAVHLANSLRQLNDIFDPAIKPQDRAEDAAHDKYFCIQRVEGSDVSAFVRMVLTAHLILLEEITHPTANDTPAPWEIIHEALTDLQYCLVGVAPDDSPTKVVWEKECTTALEAKRRWIRGHQLFAVLTQGLIFSLQSLVHAIRVADDDLLHCYAQLSIKLLQGSAGTFRFTGNFSSEEYEKIVRPSMMPPATDFALSGLMSVDHRFLVQLLRDMRPTLKALREKDCTLHDRLAEALGRVYDVHVRVCERFVGNKPSILTAESTDKSGPQLIEQFKKLRLKPFEHD